MKIKIYNENGKVNVVYEKTGKPVFFYALLQIQNARFLLSCLIF
jgi:hypothetical protein